MQIFTKKKKGFTLIELLVVIAIIGILSGIVLVSLSGAQRRARDARIMSEMAQVRSIAEVYYGENNNSYVNLCNTSQITNLRDDMYAQGVVAATYGCNASTTSYCIRVQLNSGQWYCVDSDLKSYATQTNLSSYCAGSSYTCP